MILSTRGLTRTFGALTAVDDVTWGVERGQTKAVIGPNGAGKTTFFNMLSGVLAPTDGEIRFKDTDITDAPPHEVVRMGLIKTFQRTNIYDELSVFDNIRIAAQADTTTFDMLSRAADLTDVNDRTDAMVDRLDLTDHRDEEVSTLSYGDQRKVEIGIALVTDPDLIMLDEPTAGMSREETGTILDLIRDISNESGLTVLITEHDMEVILNLADEITVLHEGSVISEGSPDEITEDEDVQRVYLGRD